MTSETPLGSLEAEIQAKWLLINTEQLEMAEPSRRSVWWSAFPLETSEGAHLLREATRLSPMPRQVAALQISEVSSVLFCLHLRKAAAALFGPDSQDDAQNLETSLQTR